MVAAAEVAAGSRNPTNPRKNSPAHPRPDALQNPHRPPLIPSEKGNAGGAMKRSRTKEITSRYLCLYGSSSSSTSSYSASTCSGSSSPLLPSPLAIPRPATSPSLVQSSDQKRSHSVDRARASSPSARLRLDQDEPSAAARALCTTTRSLSVSFQGGSFFIRTSRARAASPGTPTAEPRRGVAAGSAPAKASDHLENSRPFDNHHRWPASRAQQSNPSMRSLNCSFETTAPMLATVSLLQHPMVLDLSTGRVSFDGCDLSASSDTESVSSGSNSGTPEFNALPRAKAIPRGISVPARYRQEMISRLSQHAEPYCPLASPDSRCVVPKLGVAKKLSESPLSSPRLASSPLHRHVTPPSPRKVALSPSRSVATPLRSSSDASTSASPIGSGGNAPSILSFAAEVRRAKRGENRIEEAHLLRLLDNRHLQWRCVNARANSVMLLQKVTVEKNLYGAWITTSGLREAIITKRIKLQLLAQNLKLTSVLNGQMAYLEQWSLIEGDYSTSLLGATEALKASALRLPIVSGAKADILEIKDAVDSAVDMMHAIGFTIFSLLAKVERTDALVSDITKLAEQERVLLDQSKHLLSTAAAMHAKQCSLQGHLVQLNRKASSQIQFHSRLSYQICDHYSQRRSFPITRGL